MITLKFWGYIWIYVSFIFPGEECEDQCVCYGFKFLSNEIVGDLCSLSKYNEQCPVTCQTCSTQKTTTKAPKATIKTTKAPKTKVKTTTIVVPKTSAPIDGCTYKVSIVHFPL